ncbi:Gfo/Idh/MocA family protein [Winogradskyella flava]|uniref:Gfo/Idh/MocA family protein n=1 Tax=Winogradskyella flava TaxID=1884876 RepID=UPI002490ACF8|nr:Gfo/Idh/MocA family oxidoreductase [Winogradskyella flava]
MKEVVWGIIGCGDVTEVKSGPAFKQVENSRLLAVMRRDAEKAEDYAVRHKVPLFFNDAKAIINHKDINAVYIATPPSTHLEYALKVLKTNKNVYIEKPMTLNFNEAILLRDALKKSTAKLTIAHYRRQLPMFLEVKRVIDEKVIGDITSVNLKLFQSRKAALTTKSESNWRINPKISGGGYFNDLAPHQLDLLIYWFGAVERFSGSSTFKHSTENVASQTKGTINFKNGISCNAIWDFIAPEGEELDECRISGTHGSVAFPLFGKDIILESKGRIEVLTFDHPKHIQQPLIQATVNHYLGKSANPCPIEDGIMGMQIIDEFSQ